MDLNGFQIKNQEYCLLNNVITTKSFSLDRGIDQGDSISAIDALEISIFLIKSNNNIKA